MRPFWLAALALAGCSLIYNPDDLRHDAAPPPDATPTDADRSALALTSVDPMSIDEGVGADNGRSALFVIAGDDIAPDATVTAQLDPGGPAQMDLTPGFAINSDHTLIVVSVAIPMLGDLAAGDTRMLELTVTQTGADPKTEEVTVNGLDELTDIASYVPGTTYSEITLGASHHFTGTAPIILSATGGITVTGTLDVDASGQTAGAGGCGGGAARSPGDCGSQGGRQGADAQIVGLAGAGGGGGGYGDDGSQGSGTMAGAGGMGAGNDMLVPITTTGSAAGNRGAGGGGGGNGTIGNGGVGGGGGGVIELAAGGDLTISGGLSANGSDGAGNNGGGGGGSGGAVLVRAGGVLSAGTVSAQPGAGASATNHGGAGSVGRVRLDGASPTATSDPPAIRGPAWDAASPTLTTSATITLTLHGQSARSLGVRTHNASGDSDVSDVAMGAGNSGTVNIDLVRGRNTICALYTTNAMASQLSDEAVSCIDVGYTN